MSDTVVNIESYLNAKEGTHVTVCDKCKAEFVLSKDDIMVSNVNVHGEDITLTHFSCKECKELYVVLIDTNLSLVVKSSYQKTLNTLTMLNSRKVKDTKRIEREQNKLEKKRKKLEKIYTLINNTYQGKFVNL